MRVTIDLRILLNCIFAILTLFSVFFYTLKGRKSNLLHSFLYCKLLIFIWLLGGIIDTVAINIKSTSLRWNGSAIQFLGVCFISLCWLIFSMNYAKMKFAKNQKSILLISIPFIIIYLLMITNSFHGLFYKDFKYDDVYYGIVYIFHTILSCIYFIAGTIILIRFSIINLKVNKGQAFLVIFAAFFPLIVSFVSIINNNVIIDFTPVSFLISLIILSFTSIKYRLLNITPIAAKEIVRTTDVPFVIIDNYNKIVDYNHFFITNILGGLLIEKDTKIKEIIEMAENKFKNKKDFIKKIHDTIHILEIKEDDRLTLKGFDQKSYDVNISCSIEKGSCIELRTITFNDITIYDSITKKLVDKKKELVAMNEEVMSINEQLSQHAIALEELAISKEKNRLAKDVHDTLGCSMIMILTLMEESKRIFSEKPHVAEKKLHDAIDVTRKELKEIRRSVIGLAPEKLESENVINAINELVEEFRNAGMKIDFSSDWYGDYKNPLYSDILYKTCQEALTNSLKHGCAKKVVIILKLINKCITLFIIDDGRGCRNVRKRIGLSSMEERISKLNGLIKYGSGGERGFSIFIKIPLEVV